MSVIPLAGHSLPPGESQIDSVERESSTCCVLNIFLFFFFFLSIPNAFSCWHLQFLFFSFFIHTFGFVCRSSAPSRHFLIRTPYICSTPLTIFSHHTTTKNTKPSKLPLLIRSFIFLVLKKTYPKWHLLLPKVSLSFCSFLYYTWALQPGVLHPSPTKPNSHSHSNTTKALS